VLRDRWARWILVITLLEGALVFSSMAFVPSFLHDTFGLSPGQAGAVMALYAGAGLVYTPLARHVIRRLGERGQALVGACTIAVGTALLAASPAWGWAVPACLLTGLGFFMLHSTLQTHATQTARHGRLAVRGVPLHGAGRGGGAGRAGRGPRLATVGLRADRAGHAADRPGLPARAGHAGTEARGLSAGGGPRSAARGRFHARSRTVVSLTSSITT
jgi:MFS family permease